MNSLRLVRPLRLAGLFLFAIAFILIGIFLYEIFAVPEGVNNFMIELSNASIVLLSVGLVLRLIAKRFEKQRLESVQFFSRLWNT